MYDSVWLCKTKYDKVWLCMTPYDVAFVSLYIPLWTCMIMYNYIWLYMTVWLCKTLYDYIWLYMTVWLCKTLHDYAKLCMAIYDYVRLCGNLVDFSWHCVTLCYTRWERERESKFKHFFILLQILQTINPTLEGGGRNWRLLPNVCIYWFETSWPRESYPLSGRVKDVLL